MSYVFYFFGYVLMYLVSKNVGEEDTPEWYHVVTAAVWPFIITMVIISKFNEIFLKGSDEV